MPLPLLLGIGAAAAGIAGIGNGIQGAVKIKEANDTIEAAKNRNNQNIQRFKKENETTTQEMDKLGKLELEILHSFNEFSDIFEQIKNRPVFDNYSKNGITLPKYDSEKIKEVSVGAGVLLGGLSGAGLGAAGGLAAAGATTSAVMALGTASTGTAIASLNGAALINATLSTLGGGAIAAGGGGIALGTTILSAATLGVGLFVGGVIFNITGETLSDKADEAWSQMKKAESKIDKICDYLIELRKTSAQYYETLSSVNNIFQNHLDKLENIVAPRLFNHKLHLKNDWNHLDKLKSVVPMEQIHSLQTYLDNQNYLNKLKSVVPMEQIHSLQTYLDNQNYLNKLKNAVTIFKHTNWNSFTDEEKKLTENTVLLVNLLYNMCKVELVLKAEEETDMNSINIAKVENSIKTANIILMNESFA